VKKLPHFDEQLLRPVWLVVTSDLLELLDQ
jgi:hypothetical protein